MSVTRTQHTVLAQVSSHKSGGRATILVGHKAMTEGWTDPALTSAYFLRFALGTNVVVRITLSGRRRLIKSARREPDAETRATFNEVYGEALEKEAAAYLRVHGEPAPSEPDLPDWLRDEEYTDLTEEDFLAEVGMNGEEVEVVPPAPVVEGESDWATKIYVSAEDRKVLNAVRKLSEKKHVGVMMIGPSGYGKTSVPQQMAADWGMDFLRWDCATVRDPEEFFGFRGAKDGSTLDENGDTIFVPSNFTKAVETGNVVVVLDELNRIDPYISNILFPMLDHAGRTSVAGHEIVIGPNVIFVATLNLGYQFTGTFTLDAALTNRFPAKILVNALPSDIEAQIISARGEITMPVAYKVIRVMEVLRRLNEDGSLSVDASTRVSIQIAELIGAGLTMKEAFVYVVINGVSKDEAKMVVDAIGAIS